MDEQPSTDGNVLKLPQYFRKTYHNDREAEDVCELLRTYNLDLKRDGLPLVRSYLRHCVVLNMSIVKTMASCGYFNVQDSIGQTPLHWIIAKDKLQKLFGVDAVKAIIQNGGDPAIEDLEGDNVMHLALITKMSLDYISAILEGQPIPSPMATSRNKKGWTPMMLLVSRSLNFDVEIIKALVRYGSDINEKDSFGGTLLHYLFSNVDYVKSPKFIHCYKHSPVVQPKPFRDFEYVISFLVGLGADVNIKNDSNFVPLRLAIDLPCDPHEGIEKLVPSVDILNYDSIWNGSVIDLVLKSQLCDPCRDDLAEIVIRSGADHVSRITLTTAIDNEQCSAELVELLVH